MQSTVVNGTRSAAAGSGTQTITGVGFTWKAAIVFATQDNNDSCSWGFIDDADAEMNMHQVGTAHAAENIRLIRILSGADEMNAVGARSGDDLNITWTKVGAGMDTSFSILFLG